nr:hypothetical protein [Tanacetum cinerariifolium]
MARLQFCDYHNMVAILEKSEHNIDFHPMVDFIEASPLRYALTVKPTVYVCHIRQFWSTARIKTTEEGTKILATVDGILRTVTESSLRINLKLKDEDGIKEMATVLTPMDATTVLASGAAEVPTGSGSIPTTGPPAAKVPTVSDVVPTASPVFATATVVTPYRKRKGKEVMVESETPKKQKV